MDLDKAGEHCRSVNELTENGSTDDHDPLRPVCILLANSIQFVVRRQSICKLSVNSLQCILTNRNLAAIAHSRSHAQFVFGAGYWCTAKQMIKRSLLEKSSGAATAIAIFCDLRS